MKTAIITDTSSSISLEEANKLGIHLIPLDIIFINEDMEEVIKDKIGLDKALDIALQDANVSLNEVEIIKEAYNEDDNTSKYEISFTNNNTEYDYEIDATSGEIIKVDKEKI